MGHVYLAHDSRTGATCALKLIAPDLVTRELGERFAREARILDSIAHPGIARLLDYGDHEFGDLPARPWLDMEFVDGMPLVAHADARALSTRDRVGLLGRVCQAVAHAHA
jgi:serine/threonine protein kinase